MDIVDLKPIQFLMSNQLIQILTGGIQLCGIFEELPNEILELILKGLDHSTAFKILPRVCKKFLRFHFCLIAQAYASLGENFQFQFPTSFHLEILRTVKRFSYSIEMTKLSKNNCKGTQLITNLCPPKRLYKWFDGTLIPENLCVLVFTVNPADDLSCDNIDSMIFIPKVYPNDQNYLEGLGKFTTWKYPNLKRLALFGIAFDTESHVSLQSCTFDLICIKNCLFQPEYMLESYLAKEEPFHTKTLHLEPSNFYSGSTRLFFKSLEELTICHLIRNPLKNNPVFCIDLSTSSSLSRM